MPIPVGLSCDVPPGTFLTMFRVMFLAENLPPWRPIVLLVNRRRFVDTEVSYKLVVLPAIVWLENLGTGVATLCWFDILLHCRKSGAVDWRGRCCGLSNI